MYQPPNQPPYRPPYRPPWVVGEDVDKVLGFLAGLLWSVMGLIATIVVMFIWAGSDPTAETEERRDHARSVSVWSGVGCAIPAILLVIAFVTLVSAHPAYP